MWTDRTRTQIKGEHKENSLPGGACEFAQQSRLSISLTYTHTHIKLTAESGLPVSVHVTWRKVCVSVWSGATWSWNWCCWSSSVPSDHGSLPRNDCTLHTQEEEHQTWQPLKDRNDCDECVSDEHTGKTHTCINTPAQTQVKGIIVQLAHHDSEIFNLHYVFNCQNLLLKQLFSTNFHNNKQLSHWPISTKRDYILSQILKLYSSLVLSYHHDCTSVMEKLLVEIRWMKA